MKKLGAILICVCILASTLWTNGIKVYAADSVTITSPKEKDYDSSNTMNFRWNGNASYYHINLAKKSGSSVLVNTNTTDEYYSIPGGVLSKGEYTFTVEAYDKNDKKYDTEKVHFTLDTSDEFFDVKITSPDNNEAIEGNYTFRWNGEGNIDHYEVDIKNKDTGNYILEDYETSKERLTYNLPEANYYIRVKAFSNGDTESDKTYFYVEGEPVPDITIQSPSDGTTLSNKNVTINWNRINKAHFYKVYIDGRFIETLDADETSKTMEFSSGTYKVKVKAYDIGSTFMSSDETTFTILTQPEPDPVPSIPTNVSAAATGNSVTVSWSAVEGATSYTVSVNGDEKTTSDTSYTYYNPDPVDQYDYAVKANNASGSSAYCNQQTLSSARASVITASVSPTSGKSGDKFLFTVRTTHNATGIIVKSDKDTEHDMSNSQYTLSGAEKVWTFKPGVIGEGQRIFTIYSKDNKGTNYSSYKIVKLSINPSINLPAVPSDIYATVTEDSVTVSWSAVEGATSYTVSVNGDEKTTSNTSYTYYNPDPSDQYHYAVKANNEAGSSAYSIQKSVMMDKPHIVEQARRDLMTLVERYPDVFNFQLAINKEFDDYFNECLLNFANAYGYIGRYTTIEELIEKLNDVINNDIRLKVTYKIKALNRMGKYTTNQLSITSGTRLILIQYINGKEYRQVSDARFVNNNSSIISINGATVKVIDNTLNRIITLDALFNNKIVVRNYKLSIKKAVATPAKKNDEIILQLGNSDMYINGARHKIDNTNHNVTPITKNQRSCVPIRAIIEAMGGSVKWDGKDQQITINVDNDELQFWIGKKYFYRNGVEKYSDAAPFFYNSRTMLPIRVVAENIGCDVQWDGAAKKITIRTQGIYSKDEKISFQVNLTKELEDNMRNTSYNNETETKRKHFGFFETLIDKESSNFRLYINRYRKNVLQQGSAWLGNYVFGSNYDKQNIYKQVLIDYFEYVNTGIQKKNELMEKIDTGKKILNTVDVTINRLKELQVQKGLDLSAEIAELKLNRFAIKLNLDNVKFNPEKYAGKGISEEVSKLQASLKDVDMKLNAKNIEFEGVKFKEDLMKMDYFDEVMVGIDLAIMTKKTYDDYVKLKSNIRTMEENLYLLETIADKSKDSNLRAAARELMIAGKNEFNMKVSRFKQQATNAGFLVINQGIHKGIELIPVVGVWIEVGINIVNMTMPVEEQAKCITRLWGISEIVDLCGDKFERILNEASSKKQLDNGFYLLDAAHAEEAEDYYISMMNLTLFGETEMIEFMNLSNDFYDGLSRAFGSDGKKKVTEACKFNIKGIKGYRDVYITFIQ